MDETGGGDSGGSAGAAETAANDNVAPPEAANDNVGARGPSDGGAANADARDSSTASPETPVEARAGGQPEQDTGTPADIGAGGPRETAAIAEQPSHEGSPAQEAANDNRPAGEPTPGSDGQAADAGASTVEAEHPGDEAGSSDAQPRDATPVETANPEAPPPEIPSTHDAETSPDSAVDTPSDAEAASEVRDDVDEGSDVAGESPERMADVAGDAAGDEGGGGDTATPSSEATEAEPTERAIVDASPNIEAAKLDARMGEMFEGYDAYQGLTPAEFAEKWQDSEGKWEYPENNGAIEGTEELTSLEEGDLIDRYGPEENGSYTAPLGTPFNQRGLPPDSVGVPELGGNYHRYEVLKPFEVESATTAPCFDQDGGGVQYRITQQTDAGKTADVDWLVQEKYLRRLD